MNITKRYLYSILIVLGGIAYCYGIIIITRPKEIEVIEEPSYKVTMSPEHAQSVIEVINAESFDDAFRHYSTYKDIGDQKFHELRAAYIAAADELMVYLVKAAGNKPELPYYMSYNYEDRN